MAGDKLQEAVQEWVTRNGPPPWSPQAKAELDGLTVSAIHERHGHFAARVVALEVALRPLADLLSAARDDQGHSRGRPEVERLLVSAQSYFSSAFRQPGLDVISTELVLAGQICIRLATPSGDAVDAATVPLVPTGGKSECSSCKAPQQASHVGDLRSRLLRRGRKLVALSTIKTSAKTLPDPGLRKQLDGLAERIIVAYEALAGD